MQIRNQKYAIYVHANLFPVSVWQAETRKTNKDMVDNIRTKSALEKRESRGQVLRKLPTIAWGGIDSLAKCYTWLEKDLRLSCMYFWC